MKHLLQKGILWKCLGKLGVVLEALTIIAEYISEVGDESKLEKVIVISIAAQLKKRHKIVKTCLIDNMFAVVLQKPEHKNKC